MFSCFLLLGLSTAVAPLQAQNSGNSQISAAATSSPASVESAPLPNAPSASEKGAARVSGIVLDTSGAAVSEAEVTLTEIGNSRARSRVTGADGSFTFTGLLTDSYVITVNAKGFQQVRLTGSQCKVWQGI